MLLQRVGQDLATKQQQQQGEIKAGQENEIGQGCGTYLHM